MSAATPVVSGDRQECVDVSVHGPASLSAARMGRKGTLDMMLLGFSAGPRTSVGSWETGLKSLEYRLMGEVDK